jgi:hypothetical protein
VRGGDEEITAAMTTAAAIGLNKTTMRSVAVLMSILPG